MDISRVEFNEKDPWTMRSCVRVSMLALILVHLFVIIIDSSERV